jgi:cold shock CspA family protein/ribosome-associated translation inhibitor RaiA
MEIPLEITLRDVTPNERYVEEEVRKKSSRLEKFSKRIIRCRVVVESPHRSRRDGTHYTVKIELVLPGRVIVINRERHLRREHEDIRTVLRDAFDAAKRKLEDHAQRRRGEVKVREAQPHGVVCHLSPEHGFIRTLDGYEIYFHENSVVNRGFRKLDIRSEVRFIATEGDKGLQASTVYPVGKHHAAALSSAEEAAPQ